MEKTVTIGIAPEDGQLWIEDGSLFVGEIAHIVFKGVSLSEGHSIRLTVFDRDGVTPLADNSADPTRLDLRGDALRKKFVRRDPLVLGAFAREVEDGDPEKELKVVNAHGMICISWSPFVWDAFSGEVATLRGPRGWRGDHIEEVKSVGETLEGRYPAARFSTLYSREYEGRIELLELPWFRLIRDKWDRLTLKSEGQEPFHIDIPVLQVESASPLYSKIDSRYDRTTRTELSHSARGTGQIININPDVGEENAIHVPKQEMVVRTREAALHGAELGAVIVDTTLHMTPEIEDINYRHMYTPSYAVAASGVSSVVELLYRDCDYSTSRETFAEDDPDVFEIDGYIGPDPALPSATCKVYVRFTRKDTPSVISRTNVSEVDYHTVGIKFNALAAESFPDVTEGMIVGGMNGTIAFDSEYGVVSCLEVSRTLPDGIQGLPGVSGVGIDRVSVGNPTDKDGYREYDLAFLFTDGRRKTFKIAVWNGKDGEKGEDAPKPGKGVLTLKNKDGETLGTFGANDEENTEITIPGGEGGDGTLKLTRNYSPWIFDRRGMTKETRQSLFLESVTYVGGKRWNVRATYGGKSMTGQATGESDALRLDCTLKDTSVVPNTTLEVSVYRFVISFYAENTQNDDGTGGAYLVGYHDLQGILTQIDIESLFGEMTSAGRVDIAEGSLVELLSRAIANAAQAYDKSAALELSAVRRNAENEITDDFALKHVNAWGDEYTVIRHEDDYQRWWFEGGCANSYWADYASQADSLTDNAVLSLLYYNNAFTKFAEKFAVKNDLRSAYPVVGYSGTAASTDVFQSFFLEKDSSDYNDQYFLVGGKGTGLFMLVTQFNRMDGTYSPYVSSCYDLTNRKYMKTQRIGGFAANAASGGYTVICAVESDSSSAATKPLAYYNLSTGYSRSSSFRPCTFPSNTVTTSATSAAYNAKSGLWCIATVGNLVDTSRFDAPNPVCMLSTDGKTFSAGPAVSASCSAYSVVPFEDGFVFMRDASDEEGQMLKCTNIRKVNDAWEWDLTSLTLFPARSAFDIPTGDIQLRGLAYGNGFFLVGANTRNRIAKVYPDGRYCTVDLPDSGDTVKSITFHKGTFFIAAGNHLYMTMTGEPGDIREFFKDHGSYGGKCYGVAVSDELVVVAASTLGTKVFERKIDDSLSNVDMVKTMASLNFIDGERMTF